MPRGALRGLRSKLQMSGVQTASATEWRLVLDTALDAVVVMNADGTIAEWNDRAVEIFGWTREEALGRPLAELIIPASWHDAHYRGLRKFLDTGEGPLLRRRVEVTGCRKNGEEFPVELSIAPVGIAEGIQFVGCLRDISERKRAEEQQQLLLGELDHRVKNMLAVVAAIAAQTARASESITAFNEKFLARLQALGRAHSLLTAQQWRATLLSDLVGEILAPHAPAEVARLAADGPSVMLDANKTLALSLIFHELVTNASKYGALAQPAGRVSVSWSLESKTPPQLTLTWKESGVGPVQPPRRRGFGSRLIETSTRHELGGRVSVVYDPDGIRYEFQIPLPYVRSAQTGT